MRPTDKQAEYREALINRAVQNMLNNIDERNIFETYLIVNLPEPSDIKEASEQIDAIKGWLKGYARTYKEWYSRVTQCMSDEKIRDLKRKMNKIADNYRGGNPTTCEQAIKVLTEAADCGKTDIHEC